MKRMELQVRVDSELKHIPRGAKGSPQNMLREFYNGMRRHDLSKDGSIPPGETLRKGLEWLKKDYPDFTPVFDREFFKI